jgi:hypothetical protein
MPISAVDLNNYYLNANNIVLSLQERLTSHPSIFQIDSTEFAVIDTRLFMIAQPSLSSLHSQSSAMHVHQEIMLKN